MAQVSTLKKPIVVWIVGLAFVLAPLGNTMISLYQQGYEHWYAPVMWLWLLSNVPTVDLVFLGLIFLAGVALFFQTRTSWFIAIIVVLLISTKNFFLPIGPDPIFSMQNLPVFLNIPLLAVLFFYRYPYLDKRDHIFEGIRRRYSVNLKTKIAGVNGEAIADNLSTQGAHICWSREDWKPAIGDDLDVEFEFGVPTEGMQKVRLCLNVMYFDGTGFGGRFVKPTLAARKALKSYCRQHGQVEKREPSAANANE